MTENNDIVFIDEQKILSPFHAEKNGEDVTNSLKYDTLYSDNVKGNENDVIDLQFRPENSYSSKEKICK
ncbi:MAG: hypothetical protein R3A12_17900 [Ignavibacteria bacterium]